MTTCSATATWRWRKAPADSNLRPGQTIPLTRTEPALDLDAVIGGFKPLFRALNPEQVNDLTQQLIEAFEGQAPRSGPFSTGRGGDQYLGRP